MPAGGSKSQRRSGASKREQKPGSATKRPAAPRPPKTLQRALSTDQQSRRSLSRGPSNMIALMRSATSTSLPTVKREGSESANLRRLPPRADGDSQRRPALSRSSSSVTASHDVSKASRKAIVDAQVKDAIAALRKPNREVVGQAMEEADQQRALASQSKRLVYVSMSAKHANSYLGARRMQRSQISSVVKATPANNRFRDVFAAPGLPDTPTQHTDDIIPPSSIGPFIPSTGQRNSFRNPMDLNTSPAIDTVGSTPTKRSATTDFFLHRAHDDEPCVPPSPLVARTNNHPARHLAAASSTRTNSRLQLPRVNEEADRPPRSGRDDHVFATPAKKQQQQQPMLSASPTAQRPRPGGQKSIYETLGWDDDYDI